jgi:hypothetical protein
MPSHLAAATLLLLLLIGAASPAQALSAAPTPYGNKNCSHWKETPSECARVIPGPNDKNFGNEGHLQACYYAWVADVGNTEAERQARLTQWVNAQAWIPQNAKKLAVAEYWRAQNFQGCYDFGSCVGDCGCHTLGDCEAIRCETNCNNHREYGQGGIAVKVCTWDTYMGRCHNTVF